MRLLRMDCDPYPMQEFERQAFLDAGADEIVTIADYDADRVVESGADAIAVVSGYLPGEVVRRLEKCKLILRMGTGYDKIDVDAAAEKNILVTYVPDYCVHDVAEHCMMLILATARKLTRLSASMDGGTWMQARRSAHITRLFGKKLGIIGMGKIGCEVGRLGHSFGMDIVAYDVYHTAETAYPFKWRELDGLLREADFVSVNCPLTEKTKNLIGARELALMKKDGVLVNTARGAVCDEQALADALRAGEIAYAGVDVHEHINVFEPPAAKPFRGIYNGVDNIILTPHYASISCESWQDCVRDTTEQLKAYLRGDTPKNAVNAGRIGENRKCAP